MNYQDFLLYIGDFDMLGRIKGCLSSAHTPVPHTGTDSGCWDLKSHFSIEVAELHVTRRNVVYTHEGEWATGGTQSGSWTLSLVKSRQWGRKQIIKVTEQTKTENHTGLQKKAPQSWGKPLQNARNSGSDEGGLLSTPCLVSRQNWWKIRWPN